MFGQKYKVEFTVEIPDDSGATEGEIIEWLKFELNDIPGMPIKKLVKFPSEIIPIPGSVIIRKIDGRPVILSNKVLIEKK